MTLVISARRWIRRFGNHFLRSADSHGEPIPALSADTGSLAGTRTAVLVDGSGITFREARQYAGRIVGAAEIIAIDGAVAIVVNAVVA